MGWTYNTLNPNAETNAPTITAVGVAFTTISLVDQENWYRYVEHPSMESIAS
jgi:hypothetical protein